MTTETHVLAVQGVTCGGCVATLQRVLGALPGVSDVKVAVGGHTELKLDDSKGSLADCREAIEDAGYDVA